ncbi:MAG TPA: trigger factor [Paenalcaligenes sp.]|nr:trigger factor [Paenalcaligenes sp.]
MQPEVEVLDGLGRRINLEISVADVEKEVQAQLRQVARTANIQGFRPGKAPLSVIERRHGPGIRYDVINNELAKSFDEAARETGLRIAGSPNIESNEEATNDETLAFHATFEVYPEITLPDLAELDVTRSVTEVGDAELEKTIDVLRQQRAEYEPREDRAAQDGDRVTLDFVGKIDGEAFDGGSADDFSFVLGEGRMLPEFEEAAMGMKAGEEKTFELSFPEDYGGEEVAGKTAEFEIKVSEVAEVKLPEFDEEMAKLLGQEDGDVEALKQEIRDNVTREVKARTQNLTKQSVMDALLKSVEFDVPSALIDHEIQQRIAAARNELQQRGVPNADSMELPGEIFKEEAERRVRLGLLIAELVQQAELEATDEQVRERVEEFAQNYEQPDEVVTYYLSEPQRRAEVEAIVLEDNVVQHVLAHAKVNDEQVEFDQLMERN